MHMTAFCAAFMGNQARRMKTTYCMKTGDIVTEHSVDHTPRRMDYLHLHPHCEILFVTSDTKMLLRRDGAQAEIQAPCAVFEPAYAMHGANVAEGLPYDRYILYFDESAPKEHFPAAEFWILPMSRAEADDLLPYFERLARPGGYDPERRLLLSLILCVLHRLSGDAGRDVLRGGANYIQQIARYISEHCAEPLTTPEIARRFLVNRNKLNRDFQEYTSMTVHDFLTEVRVNRAKQLLRAGMSVGDAAAECGFSDAGYFISVFRRACGCTPAAYRKARRED